MGIDFDYESEEQPTRENGQRGRTIIPGRFVLLRFKYHFLYGSVLGPFYGLFCATLHDCAHRKSAKLLTFRISWPLS